MKKLNSTVAAFAVLVLAGMTALTVGCKHDDTYNHSGQAHQYTCPHHPEVVQSSPGSCPKCGMTLVHKD